MARVAEPERDLDSQLPRRDRWLLLYDRDCDFCRWSVAWVLRWDRRREFEPLALQDPRAAELLADLSQEERMVSAHVVSPSGARWSGGYAAARLLRLLPGGHPLANVAARVPRLAERVYRWIADRRSAFGRPITDGAKRRADALVRERSSGAV